jgi:hypothetical protein
MKTLNDVPASIRWLRLSALARQATPNSKLPFETMPLAPFLLVNQFIIQLVSINIDQILAEEIYLSLLVSNVFALIVYVFSRLIFRSWSKANAFSAMVIISFFSFGELAALIAFLRKINVRQANLEAILICALLIGLWGLLILKINQTHHVNVIFNLLSIVFMAQAVFHLSDNGFQITAFFNSQNVSPVASIDTSDIDVERPDIYYIILDGYGRQDILKEVYSVDNSDFLSTLRSKGFYIATASNSNYIQTFLSIASSLEMTYVQDMRLRDQPISRRKQLYEITSNSEVRRLLAESGYRMVAFQNSYSLSITNADIYYDNVPVRPFYSLVINATMLRMVVGEKLIGQSYDLHRDTIFFTLDTLKTIPQKNGNYFVFAHILLPHPPFVFTDDCKIAEVDELFTLKDGSDYIAFHSQQQYIDGYGKQVHCVNRLIIDAVSQILKTSKTPPIIVIQGDHGPGLYLDWESFENSNVCERFGILNAYYFPDQNYDELYPSVSPVNSFRVILNQYFDANYSLLSDHHYYSTWNQPVQFIEATLTE